MPGVLLPPFTLDPCWRNKLNLMLWVFAAEDGDPPHAYTKLSNLLATASKDLSKDVDGGKCPDRPSKEDKVPSPSAGV